MQSVETFSSCQGNTLCGYRGIEEGETGLGWIVREGKVKEEHPRGRILNI